MPAGSPGSPISTLWGTLPLARAHRGLGSNERSQHAAARGPRGAKGDAQVAAPQGQAICPLLCLFRHLCRLVFQHGEALQLPVLAVRQLGGGGRGSHKHLGGSDHQHMK